MAIERKAAGSSRGEPILVEREGRVATVTINRPEVRNAIDTRTWARLDEVFEELGQSGQVRAVVLQGAMGTFSAGFDLHELSRSSTEEMDRSFALMEQAIARVEGMEVPVIGALRGVALGGACELLLACDIRVASRTARLGVPVARLGLVPSPDFARRVVRLAGPSRARDLLFTARLVRAPEAMRWGLINYIVPEAEVEEAAWRLAARIAALAPSAVRASKRLTREAGEAGEGEGEAARGGAGGLAPGAAGGRAGAAAHRFTSSPDELREGLRAWLEKREPEFGDEAFRESQRVAGLGSERGGGGRLV